MPLKKTSNEFLKELELVNSNIKILGKYINAKTRIQCKCKKCNGIWSPIPDSLLRGIGCPFCVGKTILVGFNDMWTTNPELAKLLANPEDGYKYTQNSNKQLNWRCPDCGNIIKNKAVSNVNKNGLSCNICGDGIDFPEKFMVNLLNQLKIDYIFQYSPEWIKPKRYDFYISSMNLIIEMDGEFHYKDNGMSGQTVKKSMKIDDYKNDNAILHGIHIIRIDCNYRNSDKFIYIKDKLLASKLSNIFDFSCINWNNIYENSQKNLVYEVCKYKKLNPILSTLEIGNVFKLHRSTIIKYLKCGDKLNWCNYNPKDEMRKSGLYQMSMIKNRNTKVICVTTGKIYESIQMAEKLINCKGISDCCRHKHHYTGKLSDGTKMVWKYYDEYLKEQADLDNSKSA